MQRPFRFLHASDLHLERPAAGLAELPDHLRALVVDAPYRAAERVFDAAVKERVDFVVLSGDVIDPAASGPRGIIFLTEQFHKLAERGIAVYWAGGTADDFERWSDRWPLDANVVRFHGRGVQRIVHERNGEPIAHLLGISARTFDKVRPAEFMADTSGCFTLAVAYGAIDQDDAAWHGLPYWALGGEHERRSQTSSLSTIHYPGTPQGREFGEPGARGCTLVDVDAQNRPRMSLIATDAVRYQRERLAVEPTTTIEQLHTAIGERIVELTGDPFGPDLLIEWIVAGSVALDEALRHGNLSSELTARLRAEHGQKRPSVWTIAVGPAMVDDIWSKYENEETILGEFLRTVRHYVEHPEDRLSLEPFMAEHHVTGNLGPAMALVDAGVRRRVLAEVAHLGTELLGPRDLHS